ncbi:MAG: hypothetical protein ACLQUZ_06010 [Rhizomicrobium sp.]
MLLKPEDRPLFLALLAIAFALLLNAFVGEPDKGHPTQHAPSTQQAQDDSDSCARVSVLYWPLCSLGNAIYAHREVVNASSTLVIGLFTFALFFATYGQLRHLRREFVSTHRPKIIVRGFEIDNRDLPAWESIGAMFVAQNIGETRAKITEVRSRTIIIWATSALPANITMRHKQGYDVRIEGGGMGREMFHIDDGTMTQGNQGMEIYAGTRRLFFVGVVRYMDDNGTVFETGFCREYIPREDRWTPVVCEYEYAY